MEKGQTIEENEETLSKFYINIINIFKSPVYFIFIITNSTNSI